jgi:polysaccharide biosynthesis protein PslG
MVAIAAAALVLLPAAAMAQAPVANEFYGTWADNLSPTRGEAAAELTRQAATGLGVLRQHIWWDRIETSKGFYDWRRTDQLVGDAADRGLRILPVLLHPPAFYSSKPAGSTSASNFPPSDNFAMGRFADKFVRRYGRNGTFWCPPSSTLGSAPVCRTPYLPILSYQVWNEPDWPSWWGGSPNAGEYARMLAVVSASIHLADPRAEVVLAGLTTSGASIPGGYLDQLYMSGAGPFFDSLAVHAYAKEVAGVVDILRRARAIAAARHDATKPMWVTEYGWATGGFTSPWAAVEVPCQAAILHAATTRLFDVRGELGLKSIVQFMWNDRVPTREIWPFYAGLVFVDGSPKPSLGAFTEAIARRPAPAGYTLAEACPADRQAV